MIDDDAYVELAKCCTRACHVLKIATEGRGVESLSGPSKKQIEDLVRCVNPTKPSPPLPRITSGISTVSHIESVVSAHANCAHDLWEHHPAPTKECLIAWQTRIWEILRFFDVRSRRFTLPTVSELPQGDPELDNAPMVSEDEQCAQGPIKTKPLKSVPDGDNFPGSAEPSLVLLLCLISGAVPQGERASVIETVFLSRKAIDMVHHLRGNNAQAFIDVVDEVRYRSFIPEGLFIDIALTHLHSDRRWKTPILRRGSDGNVFGRCTRHAPTTSYFPDHCRSSYLAVQRDARCTAVDLGMCGNANMRGRKSRSRY
jgi:hypothetical protein